MLIVLDSVYVGTFNGTETVFWFTHFNSQHTTEHICSARMLQMLMLNMNGFIFFYSIIFKCVGISTLPYIVAATGLSPAHKKWRDRQTDKERRRGQEGMEAP